MSIFDKSMNQPQKPVSNPFSQMTCASNIFSVSPKENDSSKNPLFPTNQNYQKFNPFGNALNKQKTPEKKGLFSNVSTQPLFPATINQNYPLFKEQPKPMTQNPFQIQKKQEINPISIQNEINELIQLKKDNQLQKQMMQQMLKRIKQLQNRNIQLQTQKNQLLQRNIHLEEALKHYQIQNQKPSSSPTISVNQPFPVQTQQTQPQLPIPITKSMPIHFDYSKKDELFPHSFPISIFNEDDIQPNAFTEKTFLTVDGYAFQAYVAFNAFYAIKYIILQKVKNNYGYLQLTQSTIDRFRTQTKEQKSKNWFLFHPNMNRNVLSQEIANQLAVSIVNQMKQGTNEPININIRMSKYISMKESHCTIYHPDWTIASSFLLQLYNYLNFNGSNQDTKNIIRKNIDEWIKQKTLEHQQKKSTHQLLIWFQQKNGSFHVSWNSKTANL